MTNVPPETPEPRLAALLRTVQSDAAPPDAARLAAIRAAAQAAFEQAAPASPVPSSTVRSPVVSFTMRISVALLALAACVVVMLQPWSAPKTGSSVAFAKVLERLRAAQSLELRVHRNGEDAHVLVRSPGLVRWEQTPERYQIAAGSRLWKVDETTNTVTTGDSPWFRSADQQLDLLALLEVGIDDARPLLKSRPTERLASEGQDYWRYVAQVKSAQGPLDLEALVDAKTLQLSAITARPADAARTAPPLAELQLIAMNAVIADDKFIVAKTLTDDGHTGKISDAQGLVVVRPLLAKRWSPVGRGQLVMPGDWLRTELRGANAVKLSLTSDTQLTLGPGTLLECISPTQARLHYGQVQVQTPENAKATFELLAPRSGSQKFSPGKQLVHVDRDEKLVEVKVAPLWLAGFEGTTANQSLGSLLVNLPDGRSEPLSIGYHKVQVEIRDQIARTTIEESFVNDTPSRLEGVFHFPLPADASISGFGMWIGNELVEADIVEKQRAREIYETILREKRDPGLLEWTGGNLFKARVFPIEPRSEKRVKIVYTQVLPMRAGSYRYTYALRSDLLRTRPLRELSLNVLVNSALPLKNVTCPTHTSRITSTDHSAQVDFSAQEHTPTRDFEVRFDVAGRQSDVVVVPHRRGDDGYFLLQLTPPTGEGDFRRELVPEGEPLDLVLLCDTSASMDTQKRQEQADFVAAVLSMLGPDDRFNLVAADVGTAWAFPASVAATADHQATAQKFLSERLSLGWTNLDLALADVLKKASTGAQVIYLGDGIVTSGDTDPAAFVQRLGRLLAQDKADDKPRPTLHTITVGNTYESIVLKGLATQGGGVYRAITGEQTPTIVASELLREIASPALTNLNVEFRGVKVAAVYPERLPNLAAGMQQIMVGRYLPENHAQQGEVIVTGQRGKETVRYVAKVTLPEKDAGNAFIPRLWARSHLDLLLAQGSSQAVRDEVIALSEQFHIITPYTSLLVLETDADRERFGVQRRYEMRDGERFFAAGKENANFELLQQQMKLAAQWRMGLRSKVLRRLAQLGRNPEQFQQQMREVDRLTRLKDSLDDSVWISSSTTPISGPMNLPGLVAWDRRTLDEFASGPFGGGMGGIGGGLGGKFLGDELAPLELDSTHYDGESEFAFGVNDPQSRDVFVEDYAALALTDGDFEESRIGFEFLPALGKRKQLAKAENYFYDVDSADDGLIAMQPLLATYNGRGVMGLKRAGFLGGFYPDYTDWTNTLFPHLAPTPRKLSAPPTPKTWSSEAIALAKSIVRWPALQKIEGGLEIRRTWDTFDPYWERRSSHNTELTLYAPQSWLTRSLDADDHMIVEYANDKQRGAFSLALLLGRVRASVPLDLETPALGLQDHSLQSLHETHIYQAARVEAAGEHQQKLILSQPHNRFEWHFLFDTRRHVLLRYEAWDEGKLTSSTSFEDFVEIAGMWWAKKIITRDAQERQLALITYDIQALTPTDYAKRQAAELASLPQVQLWQQPVVKLRTARQKVADGSATFDDLLAMILHDCRLQQWDAVLKHLDTVEQLAADKPGVRWLRTILLSTMRRNDEARQRLLKEAAALADQPQTNDYYLAQFLISQAHQVTSPQERLEIVEKLRPVYVRQPAEPSALAQWQALVIPCYDELQRYAEALALRKTLAETSPWDSALQLSYARALQNGGRPHAGIAWLVAQLARPQWQQRGYEIESLSSGLVEMYRSQSLWAEMLAFTSNQIARQPDNSAAYQQHLSALVFNDKLDDAYQQGDAWIKEAQIPDELSPAVRAKLDAALYFASGHGYNLSFHHVDPRWEMPLAEAARFFIKHPHHVSLVQRMVDYRFAQSTTCARLRADFLQLLTREVATLTPEQLNFLVNFTLSGTYEFPEPIAGRQRMAASDLPLIMWEPIAAGMHKRWQAEMVANAKHALSETLHQLYAQRFSTTKLLPFLRERITTAVPEYKAQHVSALFDVLLTQDWTNDVEQEALEVWKQLAPAGEDVERLGTQVPALYHFVDAMLANRITAAERKLQDEGQTSQLTRTELAAKRAEIQQVARRELAARLAAAVKEDKSPATVWLQIEQSWLDVQLDQRLPEVATFCWQVLGKEPPALPVDEEDDEDVVPSAQLQHFFDAILRQRALATVMNLATRRNADKAAVEQVLTYLDAGAARLGDQAMLWRGLQFEMLIALDRPDDLERQLRRWIATDISTAPWRVYLAKLLAERGQLDAAIALLEAAEKDRLLTFTDYQALSNWYLVVNRRDAYERARLAEYEQMPEGHLVNMIYAHHHRWCGSDAPLPTELDERVLLAFRALFAKSASPENYLWQLRDIFLACRDFRLLQILPDSLLGRSPQQIYAFLQQLDNSILNELRNEAVADEILARITVLRKADRTTTDLRALDLLEALVERRSSEVLNQPQPHAKACLAALRRAFERAWQPGERLLMAELLHSLRTLRDEALVAEQLRELQLLQSQSLTGTREHLHIAAARCDTLFWAYQRHDEALRIMEVAVREYQQANEDTWSYEDNEILGRYARMFEGAQRHAAGETMLQSFLTASGLPTQQTWLRNRLLSLYNHALEHKGATSLGSGSVLLREIIALGTKQLSQTTDENARTNIVQHLVSAFDIAHRNKIDGNDELLKSFAFETLPAVLKQQQQHYRTTVEAPIGVLAEALGRPTALLYLAERLEQYPPRLDFTWDSGWQVLGDDLARHLREAIDSRQNIEAVEPRLLKLVVHELKRDLRSGESRHRPLYAKDYGHFWREKAADFAQAANEVYAEDRTSGRRVYHIATYLWNGLDLRPRAIEILLIAQGQGRLLDNEQDQLVYFLHEQKRYAESIPVLVGRMTTEPDNIQHGVRLIVAYFQTQRMEQLRELVKQLDTHFHQGGRWTPHNIAALAGACEQCQLYQPAVDYFREAIAIQQRQHPGAGRRDAQLSYWYQVQARAFSKLEQTAAAVDAASGAIVCWSARDEERRQALDTLEQVLSEAQDLAAYVKTLDEQVAKTGQDSPVVRKALGLVYQQQGDHAAAIKQLLLALALQNNDTQTHQALITSYDATNQKQAATLQLMQLIDLQKHDLTLYVQLAERWKDDEAQAQRAATSIIEAGANEAENHAAYAELLQSQDRWGEAIEHWKQVAELRRLEPIGLLKLAAAQIHQKDWNSAKASIATLQRTTWPPRFNDVATQVRELESQLPK